MSSSIEVVSIPAVQENEKRHKLQKPNLWKPLPKVDKSFQRKLEELKPYQEMYLKLLYQIGEDKYNLKPKSDFTVEVILPTGKFSDLSYEIIAGPTCHLVMTVCSIQEFEDSVHHILEQIRNSVYNKSIESTVQIQKRQNEIKKLIPPFFLYNLEDHHLETIREQKITIFDPTTGITVTRTMPAESEPWRIMTHKAKMELLKLNKLVKEFQRREKEHGTSKENANKVSLKSESNLQK